MTRVSVRLLVWCFIAAVAPFCALAKIGDALVRFAEWAAYSNRFATLVRRKIERAAARHGVML